MNVGHRLAEGSIMYKEVWDTCEPLSAGFYYLVNLFFGKSYWALIIISALLVSIQSMMVNVIFNQTNVYGERTSVPGYLYLIFSLVFFDAYFVSPLMLGQTFVLMVFYWSFKNLKLNTNEDQLYLSSIFLGIASLFHAGMAIYFIWLLLYLLMFIKPAIRFYGVIVLGFSAPIILAYLYFYFKGLDDPLYTYLQIWISASSNYKVVSYKTLLFVSLPMILALLIGLIYTFSQTRYINFQYNVIKLMFLYLVLSVILILLLPSLQPSNSIVLLPSLAYFASNYFHFKKNWWHATLPMFILMLACIFLANVVMSNQWLKKTNINTQKLLAKIDKKAEDYRNKRILILGNDKTISTFSKPATPYTNWRFAEHIFSQKSNFENASLLYYWLCKDQPHIILDQNNLIPDLFKSMPSLANKYKKNDLENIYILNKY
jgi:hypothetical protein